MTNPNAVATIEEKVAWLIDNPEFWRDIPTHHLSSADYRAQYLAIAREWKAAGLIAPSTAWIDAGISRAIKRARRE